MESSDKEKIIMNSNVQNLKNYNLKTIRVFK